MSEKEVAVRNAATMAGWAVLDEYDGVLFDKLSDDDECDFVVAFEDEFQFDFERWAKEWIEERKAEAAERVRP